MKGACLVFAILMLSITGYAQSVMTGKISDSNGKPVVGASVGIKGKNTGATTDASGNFAVATAAATVLIDAPTSLPPNQQPQQGVEIYLPQVGRRQQ